MFHVREMYCAIIGDWEGSYEIHISHVTFTTIKQSTKTVKTHSRNLDPRASTTTGQHCFQDPHSNKNPGLASKRKASRCPHVGRVEGSGRTSHASPNCV
jgi:hypothetical protein